MEKDEVFWVFCYWQHELSNASEREKNEFFWWNPVADITVERLL